MKPNKKHKVRVLLISTLATCLLFLFTINAWAQKKVVFDNLIYYQGSPIDTGDIITITSIETGVDGISGSAVSTTVESMEVILSGNPDYDLKANYKNLIITFTNVSRASCITTSVEFVVNEATSTADTLHITSCSLVNQYFYYETINACRGEKLIAPTTNIPLEAINLATNSDIVFDDNWNILPYLSVEGSHKFHIESEYCIEYNFDTLNVTITPASSELMVDNFKVCSNGDNANLEISDYHIYSISDLELIVEIKQSGKYLAQLNDEACAAIGTVDVELVKAIEVEIIPEEMCDKAVLSVEAYNSGAKSYVWSSGSSSETEEIVQSGKYWVKVIDDNNCQAYDSLDIEFYPFLVEAVDYTKTDATCFEEGIIDINSVVVDDQHTLESYLLRNDIKKTIVNDLNNVPEGVYEVAATAMNGCVAYSDVDIKVLQSCLEDYPAFTPDGDGIEDEYFIPYEGEIKIYNKLGMLMVSLSTPDYWDGRDDLGKILPMGNYVMITDKGKAINITIVR